MSKFSTGNVVKMKSGYIVIVTEVTDDTTRWISFGASNVSGTTQNKSYTEDAMCWNCNTNDDPDGNGPDCDCENCKGTGRFKKTIKGMNKAKFLADNVQDYIINKLTKNFDF